MAIAKDVAGVLSAEEQETVTQFEVYVDSYLDEHYNPTTKEAVTLMSYWSKVAPKRLTVKVCRELKTRYEQKGWLVRIHNPEAGWEFK